MHPIVGTLLDLGIAHIPPQGQLSVMRGGQCHLRHPRRRDDTRQAATQETFGQCGTFLVPRNIASWLVSFWSFINTSLISGSSTSHSKFCFSCIIILNYLN